MNYYISHHGIKGMHWGVRRFQNRDGSYTSAGRKRRPANNPRRRTAMKVGAAALGAAALAGTATYAVRKNPQLVRDAKESIRRYRTAHNNRAVELYTNKKAYERNVKRQRAQEARRRAPKDFYDKRMASIYGVKADRANKRYEKNTHFSSYEDNKKKKARLEWNAKVAQDKSERYLRKSNNHKARYNSPYR